MRKSLGEHNPASHNPISGVAVTNNSSSETGFTSNFGHPLDMLARTAANTHSPDITIDRFPCGNTFNGITPPTQGSNTTRQPSRIGPSEAIPTTWSTELSGIDPVERGWLDIEDAQFYFERYLPHPILPLLCIKKFNSIRFWKHLLPSVPIISFGPHPPNFEQIRRQEPILFLSMIAAAASTITIPDMFEKLQKEAVSIITYNAVVEGQKNSELLLSLLILTLWPMAPSR